MTPVATEFGLAPKCRDKPLEDIGAVFDLLSQELSIFTHAPE